MLTGIITRGIGGFYSVKTAYAVYECKARGIFRKDNITPLPGDRVCISVIDEVSKRGNIDEILPRTTQLARPAVANVNQLAAVLAVKTPNPDFLLLDKLLIVAALKGMDTVICINKIDLDTDSEHVQIAGAYAKADFRLTLLSSKLNSGFGFLKEMLTGRITVFAGQSGVGKSTILNRILNSWVMPTGDISSKTERGKHTTRHVELLEIESGGYVVDTPGFSSFDLDSVRHGELESCYPEFIKYHGNCRFKGCSHISEPGCTVREALNAGFIDRGRYERYVRLYDALKINKSYTRKDRETV